MNIPVIALCLAITLPAMGQRSGKTSGNHEFSIGAGGGLSALQYKSGKGSAGMNLHLAYRYFFHPMWGVGSGVELAWYRASLTAENPFSRSYQATATGTMLSDNAMTYTYALGGYGEQQHAAYLQIPVMAQFRYPLSGNMQLYAGTGVKVGVPLSSGYHRDACTLNTQGHFASPENVTYDNLPQHGFIKDGRLEASDSDLSVKTNVMFSLEAGVNCPLKGRYALRVGAYLDYGLTDVSPHTAGEPVQYNGDHPPTVGSIAASSVVTGKMKTVAVGVKVQFTIGSAD
jgi:hypothetical protein